MISLTTTYACGNNATFIKTSDGGATWDAQDRIFGLDGRNFFGLSFLNANFGMVCGDSGKILKTYDGGATWSLLSSNSEGRLHSILVVDTNIAFVVGDAGTLLRTTDGGISWHPNASELKTKFLNIRKLRPDFLTVVGYNGSLFRSVDSGRNWVPIIVQLNGIPVTNDFYGQVFLNDNTATLVGNPGEIVHTSDAGQTWVKQTVTDSVFFTAAINQIDGKDPNVLAFVGDYGAIASTTDGGLHWTRIRVGTTDSLRGLSFFDKYHATAVGRNGVILRTNDGGITWQFLPSPPLDDDLVAVAFPKGDTSLGIAVGYHGAILRTTNGGAKWDQMQSGTINYLRALTFVDPLTIVAVGDLGTMLKSTDAGQTWNSLPKQTTKHFYGVSFPTPSFGWAVGDSGIVLSTTDAGGTWMIHPFKKKLVFPCVAFPDSLHGFIGSGGFFPWGLFTTTDGGVTWNNPHESINNSVEALSIPSMNTIAMIGGCGGGGIRTAKVSHDGGKTWIDGSGGFIYGINFVDDLHGTVVGRIANKISTGSGIYHTTNGGLSWTEQRNPATQDLRGVCFGTTKAGTAVGLSGNIIRITTDE